MNHKSEYKPQKSNIPTSKQPFEILIKILLVTLISTASTIVLTGIFNLLSKLGIKSCSGFGGIFCSFIAIGIGAVLSLVVVTLAVRKFVATSWLQTTKIVFCTILLIAALSMWHFHSSDFLWGEYLYIPLAGSIFWVFVMLFWSITCSVMLCVHLSLRQRAYLVASGVVIAGAFFATLMLSSRAAKRSFIALNHQSIESVTFSLYKPTYIAPGGNVSVAPFVTKPDRTFNYAPFLTINYDNASGNEYSLIEFEAPAKYHPPDDCAYVQPDMDFESGPCVFVAHLRSGCDMYTRDVEGMLQAFCKMGNTLITLHTVDFSLTNDDYQHILESLTLSSASEIEDMATR